MTRWPHPVTFALAVASSIGWFGFPGLLWDVAWHRTIGRDSFLSPPHVLMYAGVAVNGLVAAWAILLGARRYGPEAFGRPVLQLGPCRVPGGFGLSSVGVVLALAGAGLDEAWHRYVGKDVNLWSPPHLVGLAGTMLIVVGLVVAVAARTRFGTRPGWWVPRIFLLFFFADLLHKSMVALDHYTLDPWGRTPDFYLFLIALMQPAILFTAVRAIGAGAATGASLLFSLEHAAILLVLRAADMRIPTFSPFPLIPALAMDGMVVASRSRRDHALTAACSGLGFVVALCGMETAWMAWAVGQPWDPRRVGAAFPVVALAAVGSAWIGWVVGGFVRSAAEDRPTNEVSGRRWRWDVAVIGMLIVISIGAIAVYRPSRAEPPAPVAALGLTPDTAFDYRDAIFWDALLPNGWYRPGIHRTYQEGIVDGRPFPVGPAWCAPDEATLEHDLARMRFGLSINGEPVPLERYPTVRRRTRGGDHCRWIGVSAATPWPGRQELVYTIQYEAPVQTREGVIGLGTTTVIVELVVKAP